jgi:hypothetical protein
MRSAATPFLVILGLAGVLIGVLVVFQVLALRGELDAARQDAAALRAEVDAMERGVPMSELSLRMTELENDIREWVVAFRSDVPADGDPTSPAGGVTTDERILEQVEEVLNRMDALDARIDEICENVPVC